MEEHGHCLARVDGPPPVGEGVRLVSLTAGVQEAAQHGAVEAHVIHQAQLVKQLLHQVLALVLRQR